MRPADLLKLCEAATPPPWKADGNVVDPIYCECCASSDADAAFIAAARTALPWALKMIEQAHLLATYCALMGNEGVKARGREWLDKYVEGSP